MPELTPGSFALGAQAGAAYLEPDLVLSKDGQLIVQSFAFESLLRLNALTNGGEVPAMFLLWTTDIDDAEGIPRSEMEWMLAFSQSFGCSQARVEHLVDARDEMEDLEDFEIG